jgi:hypothetical protein
MEISEHVLLETWELFSDFVPPGKKNDAAVRFLKIFIDADIDLDDLEELREEDEHLDYALDELASSLDEGYEDESEYEEE